MSSASKTQREIRTSADGQRRVTFRNVKRSDGVVRLATLKLHTNGQWWIVRSGASVEEGERFLAEGAK